MYYCFYFHYSYLRIDTHFTYHVCSVDIDICFIKSKKAQIVYLLYFFVFDDVFLLLSLFLMLLHLGWCLPVYIFFLLYESLDSLFSILLFLFEVKQDKWCLPHIIIICTLIFVACTKRLWYSNIYIFCI